MNSLLTRDVSGNSASDTVVRLGAEHLFCSDTLRVIWILTRRCNYSCSYCRVFDNEKGEFPSLDNLRRAVDRLSLLPNSTIHVTLTGGEPTLHPDYEELLSYLLQKLGKRALVFTISNLSRTPEFYEQVLKNLSAERERLFFIASFHYDHARSEDFLSRVEVFEKQKVRLVVQLMAHPEHMSELKVLMEALKESNAEFVRYYADMIREDFGSDPDSRYSPEDLQWLCQCRREKGNQVVLVEKRLVEGRRAYERTTPLEILARRENSFKGMWCNAGVNCIVIDQNGFIVPSVCFQNTQRDPSKNIYDKASNPLELNPEPLCCPFERCNCSADIEIPKYASGYQVPKIRNAFLRSLWALRWRVLPRLPSREGMRNKGSE